MNLPLGTNDTADDLGRFEVSDANPRVLINLGCAVAALCVLAAVGVGLLLRRYERAAQETDRPHWSASGEAREAVERAGTAPPLQASPRRDYEEYLRRQRAQLESYGWSEVEPERARIPIDRAKEMLLQRSRENANREQQATSAVEPAPETGR